MILETEKSRNFIWENYGTLIGEMYSSPVTGTVGQWLTGALIQVRVACNYWQQFRRWTHFPASLTPHTNILCISMTSPGHKYSISAQEKGCKDNLPVIFTSASCDWRKKQLWIPCILPVIVKLVFDSKNIFISVIFLLLLFRSKYL